MGHCFCCITLNNTITLAVNFPIPFPTAVLNVQATQNTVGSASRGIFYNVSATNPASFTIQTFRSRAGGGATNEFYYFAIGY